MVPAVAKPFAVATPFASPRSRSSRDWGAHSSRSSKPAMGNVILRSSSAYALSASASRDENEPLKTPRTSRGFRVGNWAPPTPCRDTLDTVRGQFELRRAQALVEPFLRKHGFSDLNEERRRIFQTRCPLHVAVRENNAMMVRQLLLARADTKVTDSAGRTPLKLAMEKDRVGSHIAVLLALSPPPPRLPRLPSRQASFRRCQSFR
mmetsp:Transcript_60544/g.159177  ORF Transcript_60544/g.159177 Transcript_60544/m.159177 type:complete len:206 (-) Transcript_60544:205-822(-)